MSHSKHNGLYIFINILLFATALLIQYNDIFTIKISSANPMLPLAVLVAFSMFAGETASCFVGMAVGIFADSAAGTPTGFNTIVFMCLGLGVCLTVRYLFNNNYRSALMLCFISAGLYFIARWAVSFAFAGNLDTSFGYLMRFALPSVVYTCVFSIPLYYLQKYLYYNK